MVEWCVSVQREGLTKSERQLLQFLALAQPTDLSILMWQWTLLRSCGSLKHEQGLLELTGMPCTLSIDMAEAIKGVSGYQMRSIFIPQQG